MKLNKLSKRALYVAMPTVAAVPMVATSCSDAPKQGDKPNVIFILMDDAGYGDFGCYGQTKTETPNIDALANNGIRFTDMYTAAPVSSPSRACLITGQHMGNSQIRENVEGRVEDGIWNFDTVDQNPAIEGQMGLKPGTPTLGTVMQQAGYATGMVGKWGIGSPVGGSAPWDMGFDFYYGCVCQRVAHNYYPAYMWKNGKKEYINDPATVTHPGTKLDEGADPYNPASYDKFSEGKTYAPDKMYENVVEFIRQSKADDKPFFLMWTTPFPHSPLQAPKEWVEKYVAKYGDEEPLVGEKCQLNAWPHNYYPCRYPHATYSAMISYFDYQVGLLVEELKAQGLYENTIIMFSSDNGPANNASSPTVWMDSAAPYRCGKGWGKRTLKEGGIRMPFIASWPAKIKSGVVSDHIGNFADVMPTVCEIAGVEAPKNDGVSLLPILSGNPEAQQEHKYLYWEYPAAGGMIAVREGKWKGFIDNVHAGNRTMQLYDVSVAGKDIETADKNVAADHPEIVERMWGYIEESHHLAEYEPFNVGISR